ncbi:hypothetical protein C8R43DRAFT_929454, partial [Mycena crocata]
MACLSGAVSGPESIVGDSGSVALPELTVESDPYDFLTLPNEIVSEIFIHFLPEYPICPPPMGLLSPTLLTRVCRIWREIAVQTPQLWRAFAWKFTTGGWVDEKSELLKAWLARSSSCPLSIEVEDSLLPDTLLDTLLSHSNRLEYGKFSASHFDPDRVRREMPSLRRLHLTLDVANLPVTFPSLPLLRTVILRFTAVDTITVLPWIQLTSLSLQRAFPEECTPILHQAVNLVHCELAMQASMTDPNNEPNVELLRLESFVLIPSQFGHTDTHCLSTFIVPALRTLHISGNFLTLDPIAALTSF